MKVFYIVVRAPFGPHSRRGLRLARRDARSFELFVDIGRRGRSSTGVDLRKFTAQGTVHVFRSLEEANRQWNAVFFEDEVTRLLEIRRLRAWFQRAAARRAASGGGELIDYHTWTRVERHQIGLLRGVRARNGTPE